MPLSPALAAHHSGPAASTHFMLEELLPMVTTVAGPDGGGAVVVVVAVAVLRAQRICKRIPQPASMSTLPTHTRPPSTVTTNLSMAALWSGLVRRPAFPASRAHITGSATATHFLFVRLLPMFTTTSAGTWGGCSLAFFTRQCARPQDAPPPLSPSSSQSRQLPKLLKEKPWQASLERHICSHELPAPRTYVKRGSPPPLCFWHLPGPRSTKCELSAAVRRLALRSMVPFPFTK
mmetsp:Transcript_80109/g.226752  ORF Transcript_80109/g.226752 Transcript_80109/m.226752 type:complete len:234 (+) Transcript_80109:364-1065(+)